MIIFEVIILFIILKLANKLFAISEKIIPIYLFLLTFIIYFINYWFDFYLTLDVYIVIYFSTLFTLPIIYINPPTLELIKYLKNFNYINKNQKGRLVVSETAF